MSMPAIASIDASRVTIAPCGLRGSRVRLGRTAPINLAHMSHANEPFRTYGSATRSNNAAHALDPTPMADIQERT